jgi:hypothetical protein
MKNPATHRPANTEFNKFTKHLRHSIANNKVPTVKLRNGFYVDVTWFTADGPEYEHFKSIGTSYPMIWNNDGTSVTSDDYDMMKVL